jgi:hypothetical protein
VGATHAVIIPRILSKGAELPSIPLGLFPGHQFRIDLCPHNCFSCGSCISRCHSKALSFAPVTESARKSSNNLEWRRRPLQENTAQGAQYISPLVEFSGARAGCQETLHAKLLTQLFGSRRWLESGANVNIIVFNNESYAITGFQMSKLRPRGAVAKGAVAGRDKPKKSLAQMMLQYKDAYIQCRHRQLRNRRRPRSSCKGDEGGLLCSLPSKSMAAFDSLFVHPRSSHPCLPHPSFSISGSYCVVPILVKYHCVTTRG